MPIKLLQISFKQRRALVKVQVEGCLGPEERVRLKQLLYNRYPKIKEHACKNSHGPTFGDCVETTSLPHVLEHVILEELKKTASPCRSDPSRLPSASSQDDVGGSNSPSFLSEGKGEDMVSDITRPSVFVAKTSNLGGGVAKIELKYYDDISTLQAIKAATNSLNEMLNACKM